MKASALVLFAVLTAAPIVSRAADAPPANVKAAFRNTFLTIDSDGRTRKIWLEPDGSWTGKSRRGLDLAGKWKMNGEKLCLSQSKPALPIDLCQTLPNDLKLGGPAVSDSSNKTGQLKLVKGRDAN